MCEWGSMHQQYQEQQRISAVDSHAGSYMINIHHTFALRFGSVFRLFSITGFLLPMRVSV